MTVDLPTLIVAGIALMIGVLIAWLDLHAQIGDLRERVWAIEEHHYAEMAMEMAALEQEERW